jgi:hemerythrin
MASTTTENLITWSDRYSVGIGRVDAEHRKLVDLINELHSAIVEGKQTTVISRVLNGLAAYTLFHFAGEETLMKIYHYPGYPQHKAEHDKLADEVKKLQTDLRGGKQVTRQVMSFLQNWLIGHIVGMDKKYTAHLQAAGVK